MKPKITHVSIDVPLEYVSMGEDEPGRVYRNFPAEPEYTSELALTIRPFDPSIQERHYDASTHGKPQVTLSGTPRALEEFGRYLIALARLKTANPAPNGHFDDVRNGDGGTVHLVVYRLALAQPREHGQT